MTSQTDQLEQAVENQEEALYRRYDAFVRNIISMRGLENVLPSEAFNEIRHFRELDLIRWAKYNLNWRSVVINEIDKWLTEECVENMYFGQCEDVAIMMEEILLKHVTEDRFDLRATVEKIMEEDDGQNN